MELINPLVGYGIMIGFIIAVGVNIIILNSVVEVFKGLLNDCEFKQKIKELKETK